jgi:hypothetical protein
MFQFTHRAEGASPGDGGDAHAEVDPRDHPSSARKLKPARGEVINQSHFHFHSSYAPCDSHSLRRKQLLTECLLRRDAMQSGGSSPTFRRNVLPPSSG